MKIARSPSARLLLWPLYFALATAGCGSITARDISADGGSTTSSPPADAAQLPVSTDGAGGAAPKATPAQADAAGAADPAPPSDKDGEMGADPKGPGAVSTGGCTKNDECGDLVCSLPNGVCVECLVDHDCKGKGKTCDPKTLTCVGCADHCADAA
jgi:hypothetical protein